MKSPTRLTVVLAVLALCFGILPARAQSNLFLVISSAGEFLGGGKTYYETNLTNITFSGSLAGATASTMGLGVSFYAPISSNLTVGVYSNAASFNSPGVGGVNVSGTGRSCNSGSCREFQIYEIQAVAGQVVRFWATFSIRCLCGGAPLTGEIRYNSALAPPTPLPRTLRVPSDFSTIQAALDNINMLALDTVLVDPGIYTESINFGNKRARLISSAGPTATYLTSTNGAAVAFGGVPSDALLSGFTIFDSPIGITISSRGAPTIISNAIVNCGTGIDGNGGSIDTRVSPVILKNTITGCAGSAISLSFGADSLIEGNDMEDNGGGIAMWEAGSLTIRNNIIRRNAASGMSMANNCNADIVQNLIIGNGDVGIYDGTPDQSRGPWIVNNTIVGNAGDGIFTRAKGGQIIANNILVGAVPLESDNPVPNAILVVCNDLYCPTGAVASFFIGANGNISVAPFFACEPGGDFHLLTNSLCVDAGTNGVDILPATDAGGALRIRPGKTNNPATVDMGAFELDPAAPVPVPCLFLYPPADQVVIAAPGQTSAVAHYPAPVATPGAIVNSTPPSGSSFPAGTNIVTCLLTYGTQHLTNTFKIIVLVPPTIAVQPQGMSVAAGTSTNLSVLAQGTAPLSYSWTFEDITIPGATNATLSLTNLQAKDEGFYRVLVSNVAGAVLSSPALVRVLPAAPVIIAGPVPVTVPAGSNAVFTVTAKGSSPLSYYWYIGTTQILNGATSQFVLNNVQAADIGDYRVVVANPLGQAASATAALNVLPAKPIFTQQPPAFVPVPVGGGTTLSSQARGTDPIGYQWRRNGTNIDGETQRTLTLLNLVSNASYTVIATNSIGAATSQVSSVFVSGTRPSFTQQPASVEVLEGNPVTLTSLATGTAPLSYQWFFSGTNLPAQTSRFLVIPAVTPAVTGVYYVVASNAFGATNSLSALVTANQSLVIQAPLSNRVVDAGSTVTLAVGLSGSGAIGYRWQYNGFDIGETNASLVITNIQATQSGFYGVVISNQYGSLSSSARISVFGPPAWVFAWGDNSGGQSSVPGIADAVSVAAGDYHSVALRHDGTLTAWGYNSDGQTSIPTNALRYVAVAAGGRHNVAIVEDGSLIAWGRNDFGQCTIPAAATSVQAVAAGDSHSLALLATGFVVGWGDNSFGQVTIPGELSYVRAIAAGRNHSLAITVFRTVTGWGLNSHGQTTPPDNLSNVSGIAAGYLHSVALLADGTVVAWGDNTYGQTNVPPGLSNVVAITAGDFHTVALRADGSIVGWGNDWFGQTDIPASLKSSTSVAAGFYHNLTLYPAPTLNAAAITGGLRLQWSGAGTLQWSTSLTGPYFDLPVAQSPYTNVDLSMPAKYFRLRSGPASP